MNRSFCAVLLAGGAIALLAGCAAPVAEQLSCSRPIVTVQTEPEDSCNPFPPRYYGFNPPRQFLRGGSGSTPLRYNLYRTTPAPVGERLVAKMPDDDERLLAVETYGLWQ